MRQVELRGRVCTRKQALQRLDVRLRKVAHGHSGASRRLAERPSLHGRMAREKRCGQIGAVRTKRSLQTAFRLPAEAGLILPQLLTEPERRLCGLLVNAAQHGQHAVPQTVSRVIIAEVGAVRDVILPVFAQERLDLAPLCEQERPDDRAAHRRNAGNTLCAAAAHQMEQHGLQIVVRGVRGRDLIPLRRLLE